MANMLSGNCLSLWRQHFLKVRQPVTDDVFKSVPPAQFVRNRYCYNQSLLLAQHTVRFDRLWPVNKLQRLQNTAARLLKAAKKNDRIMPILEELHWLPIRYRIQFKILLLVHKCLHGLAPQYLIELIKLRCPSRTLRSSNRLVLEKPIIKMVFLWPTSFLLRRTGTLEHLTRAYKKL